MQDGCSSGSRKKLIWSATPTPFRNDGSLDSRSVGRLVQQHLKLGVSGLFVGGTCGEGGFMPDRQRAQLVRSIKRAAGEKLHLAAHVSDTSAARVAENIRRMTDAGADSVVIARRFWSPISATAISSAATSWSP